MPGLNRVMMKMEKVNKQLGFTLLELMLVTALIAAISVIGVFSYKQQLVNSQVDKTALQMQQWMEGAVAYYVQNNQWPTVPSDYASCTLNEFLEGNQSTCGPTASVAYITPGSIDSNPWNGEYKLIAPANASSKGFAVATNAPIILAKRIAARLPNADADLCTQSTCLITATITAPSQGVSSNTNIMQMGYIRNNLDKIMVPSCPSTRPYPHIYLDTQQFSGPRNTVKGKTTILAVETLQINPNLDATGTYWLPQLTTIYYIPGEPSITDMPPDATMLAITTCETTQQSSQQSATQLHNNVPPNLTFDF